MRHDLSTRRVVAATNLNDIDYEACGHIAGPPAHGSCSRVAMRPVLVGRPRLTLLMLVALNAAAQLSYLGWLLAPGHWTGLASGTEAEAALSVAAFAAVACVELVRLIQCTCLWAFSLFARNPVPMHPPPRLRVAILTTIVPSHEPVELVVATLAAMRRVAYPAGTVDVWILDEADDDRVRQAARSLGVHHFSRHGRPVYNTRSGPFRARTKAGNHNAWLAQHGRGYDVVAQLDPDHVPRAHFLERTLGYFRDPDIAFVVAPQVYGDAGAGFVTRGAAAQAYVFHGIVQRGGNGLGAPLLIGTNHVYRVAAWIQVGGYQDCIIEDHLTSMTIHAATNPRTGRPWKGVYTPDVLAIGRAPSTWGDFFSQQRRWAYGATEIALRHARRLGRRLSWSQRVAYALLQSFYPGVATTWTLGTLATLAYLSGAASPPALDPRVWGALWTASVATTLVLFLWLRRLNIAEHERRELGVPGAVATLCAAPIYAAAVARAALQRPLAYHVTRKGRAARPDELHTFGRHFAWMVTLAVGLLFSLRVHGSLQVTHVWALVTLAAASLPPSMHVFALLARPTTREAAALPASGFRGSRPRTRRRRTASGPRPQHPGPPVPGQARARGEAR